MAVADPMLYSLLCGLAFALAAAVLTWAVSFVKADISIVDGMWSLMILGAGLVVALTLPEHGPRAAGVLALAALWAVRLSAHITWRNHGAPEDHRYRAIRARNQPHFEWKSLYLVFVLQAVLAWIVALPLAAAVAGSTALGWLDAAGAALVLFGLVFESVADWQLARFLRRRDAAGAVMDCGLWRYTRHPNYFGEWCVWWGFFLLACAAGGWWAVVSPLLMSVLLMKISGVGLLEKDIGERRPAYREYIARTNAFFPGPPKRSAR
jgi:steroid 5-alpha reductase family enzyme